jgi:chromosome segregation ATPase
MSEVSQRVDSISSKLHRISERLDALKRENDSLRAQKAALEIRLDEDKRKMASLTEEYNRIKLAKSVVVASGDRAEMKFKVNELVREIDKCIALLNR